MSDDKDAQPLNPVTQQRVIEEDVRYRAQELRRNWKSSGRLYSFEHAKKEEGRQHERQGLLTVAGLLFTGLAFSVTATSDYR
jgi:hypothetical protein